MAQALHSAILMGWVDLDVKRRMVSSTAVDSRFHAKPFERGVILFSFDTEQIWGYKDLLSESEFQAVFPCTRDTHEKLLKSVCDAGVSATWFLVGAMSLPGSCGSRDSKMAGLSPESVAMVPEGNESTAPLWYSRSFVEHLRDAHPRQEIGLHGGLVHLIWTGPSNTTDSITWELARGAEVLRQMDIHPTSFSFPRDEEAHHELLPQQGICCYRGKTPVLAFRLGRTLPGAILRIVDELRVARPPMACPQQLLPGLWNIPSSLFLYPISPSRARLVPLRLRIARFSRGLQTAIRERGIFHFCLHPENLAESPKGFSLFEEMLDEVVRARDRGDVEILTMTDVASRLENRVTESLAVEIRHTA